MSPRSVYDLSNQVLQERGYLVISQVKSCAIGEVIEFEGMDSEWGTFVSKLVIIAETDRADMQAQLDHLGMSVSFIEYPKYYRAIAE